MYVAGATHNGETIPLDHIRLYSISVIPVNEAMPECRITEVVKP